MKAKNNWNTLWRSEKDDDYWKIPDTDFVSFFQRYQNTIKSVLDLGCGIGRHSIFCAQQGCNVTGLDISENAINYLSEWLKKEKLDITTIVGDIFSDNISCLKYDLVISINVIYHATREEIVRIINEVYSKLTNHGIFYLTFLTRDDDKYGIGREIEPHTFLCDTSLHKGDLHYFADKKDMKDLFKSFDILSLKQVDSHWKQNGKKRFSSFWKTYCTHKD